MSSKSPISRSLFILCTLVLSVSAVDLVKKMLNIFNMFTYVGVQRYDHITRQLMIEEAKSTLNSLPGGKRSKPAVVSALWAGGDEIFFASSAKGTGTVPGDGDGDELDIPILVQEALKKCAADSATHNYDGKCGEIMVISEWLRANPEKSLPEHKAIVAVNDRGVVPPCNANEGKDTYGCTQFLHEMKFDSSEIIEKEPGDEVCELVPPGSPKGSLGKRACKRPSKGTKSTKAPKKGHVSKPKGTKPAARKHSARPVSRKPKHRRNVQFRWQ